MYTTCSKIILIAEVLLQEGMEHFSVPQCQEPTLLPPPRAATHAALSMHTSQIHLQLPEVALPHETTHGLQKGIFHNANHCRHVCKTWSASSNSSLTPAPDITIIFSKATKRLCSSCGYKCSSHCGYKCNPIVSS